MQCKQITTANCLKMITKFRNTIGVLLEHRLYETSFTKCSRENLLAVFTPQHHPQSQELVSFNFK